jgi:hypothetical protein
MTIKKKKMKSVWSPKWHINKVTVTLSCIFLFLAYLMITSGNYLPCVIGIIFSYRVLLVGFCSWRAGSLFIGIVIAYMSVSLTFSLIYHWISNTPANNYYLNNAIAVIKEFPFGGLMGALTVLLPVLLVGVGLIMLGFWTGSVCNAESPDLKDAPEEDSSPDS